MKKTLLLLLLVAALLVGCTPDTPATSSVESPVSEGTSSVEETSSEETSSEATSSKEEPAGPSFPVQTEATFEHEGITYFNVSVAAKGQPAKGDDDRFFPEDAEGYYIEKGVYQVTQETFYRIIDKPFLGDGAIKFNRWKKGNYTTGNTHLFDGLIPISRMNDPLWVVMNSPNEASNYRGDFNGRAEQNGDTLVNSRPEDDSSTILCAVYLNTDCTLPEDTEITLCIGNARMAYRFAGEDWKLVYDKLLSKPENLYPLPWQLHYDDNPVKQNVIPNVKQVDDHWEVVVKVGDFYVKEGEDSRLVGRVLHTWNDGWFNYPEGKTGADVLGMAVNYKIWVKEPEYAGVLSADTGVDLYPRDGSGLGVGQSFATKSFLVTAEPRDIYGHDVCPNCYDTVIDDPVMLKEMLGINE